MTSNRAMTAMDFLPSDLEHMNTNFLDMIENDVNSQLPDIDNITSEKLNEFLNGDLLQNDGTIAQMEFEPEDTVNSNWYHDLQWNDSSKVPQSLIDASNEVENNNPNLLVNPQSVLPMHSTHQVRNTVQLNQLNTRNGIAVKINGQDAVLTPTQHPQIQYVTVQNVGTNTINNSQIGYTVMCQPQITNVRSLATPSQNSPVLVEHLQNGVHAAHVLNNNNKTAQQKKPEKVYPKPVYSYSCLIAMALKNSRTGNLPVSEIYTFMTDNFPYFKTAPDGWKNSVRHNLSLNKCFAKVESSKPGSGSHTRKGCLWALNPAKIEKMEEEIVKWRKKDPESVKLSMSKPENLELIEQGKAGLPREPEEPSTPVKQEPLTPMTPVKQQVPSSQQTVSQILQSSLNQSQSQLANQKVVIKQEAAVIVKTEPEVTVTTVQDANSFDPALSDLAVQNNMWDEELTIGVGNTTTQSPLTSTQSPLTSPTLNGHGMLYHGNITYTANPLVTQSPLSNVTPTKTYPGTPTKIYPQTPTRVILA